MTIALRTLFLGLLLFTGFMGPFRAPPVTAAMAQTCIEWKPTMPGVRRVAGYPPLTVYPIPTGALHRWVPAALDAHHVLMFRGTKYWQASTFFTAQPIQLAVVRIGTRTRVPLPWGSYPHQGQVTRLQVSWPWIILMTYTQVALQDWKLWVGNAATGNSWVIDSAASVPDHGPPPDIAFTGRFVVWTYDTSSHGVSYSRLALYDVANRSMSFLTPPLAHGWYARPRASGNFVIADIARGQGPEAGPYDVMLYNLATHTAQRLSHDKPGESQLGMMSDVNGHVAMFSYSVLHPNCTSIEMATTVDISTGRRRLSHVLLDGEYPYLGDGFAVVFGGVLNLQSGNVWATGLSVKPNEVNPHAWQSQGVSGHNVLAVRDLYGAPFPRYAVWRIDLPGGERPVALVQSGYSATMRPFFAAFSREIRP